MQIHVHRRMVLMTITALALGPADPVFARGLAFILRDYVWRGRQVVVNPVLTLQAEFSLGYQAGIALADRLQAAEVWQMKATCDGQRAVLDARWFRH